MDDDPTPPCGCGSTVQVNWSLAFGWACAECRRVRSYTLLDGSVTGIPVTP